MNLITDPWIPVATPEGRRRITPAQIASSGALVPASPRADFDAAIYEFLVGLFQTTLSPAEEMDWEAAFTEPPSEKALHERWAPFVGSFDLGSASSPFLQELGLPTASPSDISELLIDAPGAATVGDNKDLFIKRRSEDVYCPPCAALALMTLQSFSPAGGRGNMTSIRGGGPLSTIVMGGDLWQTIWANVLPAHRFGARALDRPSPEVFPWLNSPDDPKGKRAKVATTQVHRAHVFWGMPRRVLLAAPEHVADCAVCGETTTVGYAKYSARPHGFDYQGGWIHPLSPIYEGKDGVSTRKGSADVGGYRHWVGLVAATAAGTYRPALVVSHFRASPTREEHLGRARLRASGYDMVPGKMTVRGWYEGTMSELAPGAAAIRNSIDDHAQKLVEAASDAARILRTCYKEALYDRPKDVRAGATHVEQLTDELWSRTHAPFYASIRTVATDAGAAKRERVRWWRLLTHEVKRGFEDRVQYARGDGNPKRIVLAEKNMAGLLWKSLPQKLDLTPDDLTGEYNHDD